MKMAWQVAEIAADVQAWRDYAQTILEINCESDDPEEERRHREEWDAIQVLVDAAETFLNAVVAGKSDAEIYFRQAEMWMYRARVLELQLNNIRATLDIAISLIP
jgi:hypothetical protein